MSNEIEDRRQRAREAFADSLDESAHVAGWPTAVDISTRRTNALSEAIETATRVQVTDDLIDDLADVAFAGGLETRRALVVAAFRAAGFEVVE